MANQQTLNSANLPPSASPELPDHKITMEEYHELSRLLRKARGDGRLGEAMVFSGIPAGEFAPALEKYQQYLGGGYAQFHFHWIELCRLMEM